MRANHSPISSSLYYFSILSTDTLNSLIINLIPYIYFQYKHTLQIERCKTPMFYFFSDRSLKKTFKKIFKKNLKFVGKKVFFLCFFGCGFFFSLFLSSSPSFSFQNSEYSQRYFQYIFIYLI